MQEGRARAAGRLALDVGGGAEHVGIDAVEASAARAPAADQRRPQANRRRIDGAARVPIRDHGLHLDGQPLAFAEAVHLHDGPRGGVEEPVIGGGEQGPLGMRDVGRVKVRIGRGVAVNRIEEQPARPQAREERERDLAGALVEEGVRAPGCTPGRRRVAGR